MCLANNNNLPTAVKKYQYLQLNRLTVNLIYNERIHVNNLSIFSHQAKH